jgi:hypothetical protein
VRYKPYEEIPYIPANNHLSDIDWQAKIILIRDTVDAPWQEFPFPAEIDTILCVKKRPDDTWLVQSGYCDTPISYLSDSDQRILHPDTGIYTAPEPICGHKIKAQPGEGYWVYTEDPETGKVSLCFTETGELRTNLPEGNFVYERTSRSSRVISSIDISPDGKYLLLHLFPETDRQPVLQIYSYELATSKLRFLGEIQLDDFNPQDVRLSSWLDNTHGVLMNYAYRSQDYYGFDLTQADSLEFALQGFNASSSTLYYDESARRYESILSYYQVSAEYGSLGDPFPCTLYTYDVNGPAKYELADHCLPLPVHNGYDDQYTNAYRIGNRYYFLAVFDSDETISQLGYFELTTMTFGQPWFRGEIESIGSISPDGQYVLVEVGSDLQLDNFRYCCQDRKPGISMMVYDTKVDPDSGQDGTVYVTGPAAHVSSRWLDNQTLLFNIETSPLYVENSGFGASQNGYELLKINDNDSTTVIGVDRSTVFDETYSENISPDGTYMLFQQGVLNPQTFEYTPIIRENPPNYQYQVSWEAGDMIVSVFPPVYASELDPLVKYRVKLP